MEQSLSDWLQELQADDPSLRWQAAEALGLLGQQAPRAVVPGLSRAVHDPDLDVRLQAVVSLTGLQAKAEDAVPALETALQDRDSDLRRHVAVALGSIGPFAEEAAATLAKSLEDPNANVRLAAVKALQTIGPDAVAALDALASTLGDKVPSVRRAGAEVLGQIGADHPPKTGKTITALAKALTDRDPEVCRQAAKALGALGPCAEAAVTELSKQSREGPEALRQEAAAALGHIGAKALTELQQNLTHDNAAVRKLAADNLQLLRYQARPAFVALCQAVSDNDASVAQAASAALRGLDPEPKDILPILVDAVQHKDNAVRVWAVNWLGEIAAGMDRPLAQQAVVPVIAALADSDAGVRREAAVAVGTVGAVARAAVSGLLGLLTDADRDVRRQATLALGKIDPDEARKGVPELIQALPAYRGGRYAYGTLTYNNDIATALAAIGAVEPLVEALESQDEGIRDGATAALVLMGKKAHVAIPNLVKGLQDRDAAVRLRSAKALQAMAPGPDLAMPMLLEALRHDDDAIRQWAAAFLGDLGGSDLVPKMRAALVPLMALLEDRTNTVRESATTAVGKIVEHLPRTPEGLPNEAALVQALAARLKDVHLPVRPLAAQVLGKIASARRGQGPIQQAIPALLASLPDGRPFHSEAATALGQIGLVAPLVKALAEDEDAKVRTGAAHALGRIGQAASSAVLALQMALQKDKDCHVWQQSALALMEIGRSAAAAVPDLIETFKDTELLGSGTPLRALEAIGPEADEAAPALVDVLQSPSREVHQLALAALVAIGPGAVEALCRGLDSQHPEVVGYAAEALQRIGPRAREAIPFLLMVYFPAADALASLEARGELPGYFLAGQDASPEQKQQFVDALRTAARVSSRALAAILTRMEDADVVPGEALAVIGMRSEDASVVPALALALEGDSLELKQRIVDLLYTTVEGPRVEEVRRFASPLVQALARELRALAEPYAGIPEELERRMIQTLARIGPAARDAIPALLDELDRQLVQPVPAALSEDRPAHPLLFEVARALRAILAPGVPVSDLVRVLPEAGLDERETALVLGVVGDEAIPSLLECLRHRNARVRLAAARALGELSPKTKEVCEALVRGTSDDNRQVRLSCLDALASQGGKEDAVTRAVVDGLAKAAEHWDAATRVRAGLRLAESEREGHQTAGDDKAVVNLAASVLLEKLQDHPLSQDKVRQFVFQMHRFQQTLDLLPASDDPDPSVRRRVVEVLGQANFWQERNGITDKDRAIVLSVLTRALSDRNDSVRQQAARSLGQLGVVAKGSVAALRKALGDHQLSVREAAAIALWKIDRQTEAVLPLLIDTLEQGRYDVPGLVERVRQGDGPSEALNTLVEMDTEAEQALLAALRHEKETVRVGAAVALGGRKNRSPGTVGLALSAALTDAKTSVRLQAAEALRYQGQADQQEIVSRLVSAIKEDPDQGIVLAAVTTLGVLGPQGASEPEECLLELLMAPQDDLRAAAIMTLGRWGKQAAQAISALQRALKDRSPAVRERATQTLAAIGATALPTLAAALENKDAELRKQVVVALARLGPAAGPILKEALKDSDEAVRAAAAAALGQ